MPEKCLSEVRQEIREMIAEIAEVSPQEVTEDADLAKDLGVDSMMALEIVAALEKKYRVKVPEQKIPSIRSFRNVTELLEGLLGK
ncbi:MAG: acyl carrier protein [Candidatus Omnitrophota bacterium]